MSNIGTCCKEVKKLINLIEAMPLTKNSKEDLEKKLTTVIQEEADIKINEHKHAHEIIRKSRLDGLSLATISSITGLSIEQIEKIK